MILTLLSIICEINDLREHFVKIGVELKCEGEKDDLSRINKLTGGSIRV